MIAINKHRRNQVVYYEDQYVQLWKYRGLPHMLYLRPAVCEPQLLPKRQHQRACSIRALQHIPRNTFPLKPELGECVEAELQVEVPLDDLPLTRSSKRLSMSWWDRQSSPIGISYSNTHEYIASTISITIGR